MPGKKLKRWAYHLTWPVLLIAVLSFSGWMFDIPVLRKPILRLVAMNPVSAVGILFSSLALLLLLLDGSKRYRQISLALSVIVLLLGLIKVASVFFGYSFLQIDQLLFAGQLKDDFNKTSLSLMSLNSAVNFILVGMALLLVNRKPSLSQTLSSLMFFLTWIPALGYLYRVPEFYGLLPYFPPAPQTVLCFFLLSVALLLTNTDEGWMKEFANYHEGVLLARMIPLTIAVPILLGYLRLLGHWANMFSTEFGVALLTSSIIMVFVTTVGYAVRMLNKRDILRKSMALEMERMAIRLKETNEEVIALNEELRASNEEYQSVNDLLMIRNAQLEKANETIAAQKDEQLNKVLDLTPTIVWSYDLTGNGQDYLSRSIQRIAGISAEEFLGKNESWSNREYLVDRELWLACQRRLKTYGYAEETCRFRDWLGEIHWMNLKCWITKDEKGQPLRQEGVAVDITSLKEVERNLVRERLLLRSLIDNIPDFIFVKDYEFKHVINNKANVELLGANSEEETLGKSVHEYFGKAGDSFLEDDRRILNSGISIINKEENIYNSKGELIHILTTKVPLKDEEGNIIGIIGISRDVTEYKRQESILHQYKENLEIIFNNTKEQILLLDEEGKIVLLNKALIEFMGKATGVNPQPGMYLWDMTLESRREIAKQLFRNTLQGEATTLYINIPFPTGDVILESTYEPVRIDGKIKFVIIVSSDVTENKKQENIIRKNEANLKSIFEHTDDAFTLLDEDYKIVLFNKSSRNISPQLRIGENILDLVPIERRPIFEGYLEKATQGGIAKYDVKYPIRGGVLLYDITIAAVRTNEKLVGFCITTRDLTAQHQAQEKINYLNHSLSDFQNAIYSSSIVSRTDKAGNITFVNDNFVQVSGYSEVELVGHNHSVINSGFHPRSFWTEMWETISSGKTWRRDVKNKAKDGSYYWLDTFIIPFCDEQGKVVEFLSIRNDITERKKGEEEIMRKQAQLEQAYEGYEILSRATNDAIWDWNIEQDVEMWNHGIQTIFGYTDRQIGTSQKWWKEKIHPVDYNRVQEEVKATFAQHKNNWTSQYQYRCADGSYKYVLDRAYVIYHDDKAVRMIGAMQDITEQKEFERNITAIARELSELIENANTPIFGTDRNGYVNEWNKVTAELTGYSRNEVLGKELGLFIKEISRYNLKEILNQVVVNVPASNLQIHIESRSKKDLIILVNATPRKNTEGQISGVLMVGQDISELIEYRQNLEMKVQERTRELNEALQKEKELVEMKSKFVSIASHEFRTPLSTIALVSGFLRKHREKLSQDDFNSKLLSIEKQVGHMTYLLDDILMIGKSEAGKIQTQYTSISIHQFFNQTSKEVEESTKTHRVDIQITCTPAEFRCDEKLLRNILINLLTNAIKFSPNSKAVYLRVSDSLDYLKIEVEDRGIGIAEEDLLNMFTPFYRGNNVGTISGTGLGLSIVKKAVDLLRGDIKIKSSTGAGTLFTVKLPLNPR